jgi:predicted amidohydrolase
MRAAAIQLNSTADVARNLEVAGRLVATSAADGADLIVLPEKWNLLGTAHDLAAGAAPLESNAAIEAARGWARDLRVNLVAGSVAERAGEGERLFNTSCAIDRDGELTAVYRKIHMFDVDVGGVSYRESDAEQPGEEIVTAQLDGIRVGMTVCYDLRFPELYRILAVRGARVITVPSAFTSTTGKPHWEVLLRARAIENQAFVIAPDQSGAAPPHYDSWGHSIIVDPWGDVLAQAAEGETAIAADLDLARQDEVRESLPSLANRRPHAYHWPSEVGV